MTSTSFFWTTTVVTLTGGPAAADAEAEDAGAETAVSAASPVVFDRSQA
jgi:hypothetical protein